MDKEVSQKIKLVHFVDDTDLLTSLEKNKDCSFGMFDYHDMWHFFSGAGLFFLALITFLIEHPACNVGNHLTDQMVVF